MKKRLLLLLLFPILFLFFLYAIKENAIKESPTKRPFDEWTKEDYENSTICDEYDTTITHKGDTIIIYIGR